MENKKELIVFATWIGINNFGRNSFGGWEMETLSSFGYFTDEQLVELYMTDRDAPQRALYTAQKKIGRRLRKAALLKALETPKQ